MSVWSKSRIAVGLALLGALAAAVFAATWDVMAGISLPTFLEPMRATHPQTIVWWIRVLYVGTVVLTLIPAAVFWVVAGGGRRHLSAVLAVAPLILFLVAEFVYAATSFEFTPHYDRLAWDAGLMVAGAMLLFVVFDVLHRLATGWSDP